MRSDKPMKNNRVRTAITLEGNETWQKHPEGGCANKLPRASLFTWAVKPQVFVLLLNQNAKINHWVRNSPKATTVHLRQEKHPAHAQVGSPSQALWLLSASTAPPRWFWGLEAACRGSDLQGPTALAFTSHRPNFGTACPHPGDAPALSMGGHYLSDTRTPSPV